MERKRFSPFLRLDMDINNEYSSLSTAQMLKLFVPWKKAITNDRHFLRNEEAWKPFKSTSDSFSFPFSLAIAVLLK